MKIVQLKFCCKYTFEYVLFYQTSSNFIAEIANNWTLIEIIRKNDR